MENGFLYGYPLQDITCIIYFQHGGITGSAAYALPIFFLLFISVFFYLVNFKIKSWKKSKKYINTVKKTEIIKNFVKNVIFQMRSTKSLFSFLMYISVFIPVLLLVTLEFFYFSDIYILDVLFHYRLLTGKIYLVWTFLVEVTALMITGGIIFSLYRRLVLRPSNIHSGKTDYFFLLYILLMLFLGVFKQALIINLNDFPEFEKWSFAAYPISHLFPASNPKFLEFLYSSAWYLSVIMFFSLFIIFYKTKFGHMLFAGLNLTITAGTETAGTKKFLYPFDDKNIFKEENEYAGANTLLGFDAKDRIEIDACIRCGKCHRYCPAVIAEKNLSPLTVMERLKKVSSANKLKAEFIPDLLSSDEIYECFSCGACSDLCPVLANPMKKIESLRKFQTSMLGKVSPAIARAFNNIDFYGNSAGLYDHDMTYTENLKVPHISEIKRADYVIFLGCKGKTDSHTVNIINKFHEMAEKAGIITAVLGKDETCCGDLLLRQGNELLFKKTARLNLSIFEKYNLRNIITFCPHGYSILKKEYKHILKENFSTYNYSVYHYTEIIDQILSQSLVKIVKKLQKNISYHDPCFLGRYNSEYEGPRNIIHRISDGILCEMPASKNKAMCCGGGAGKFTEKEKPGHRPNDIILREAYSTGANILATGCPICFEQFRDSHRCNSDINIEIKDIMDLVAECME